MNIDTAFAEMNKTSFVDRSPIRTNIRLTHYRNQWSRTEVAQAIRTRAKKPSL
ncbi:MAG: hypothetical protein ACLPY1_18840 [Terracidiphilus sp.]